MASHLGIMILFAACVAAVFGALQRDRARDQLALAGRLFGVFVLGAYAAGWIMYWTFK
jgi:hypothetical protein